MLHNYTPFAFCHECIHTILILNSQAVKKHEPQESHDEKDVKSKVVAQKWLWWKVLVENDNLCEFGAKH